MELAIDLFCGAGGSTAGAEMGGARMFFGVSFADYQILPLCA